MDANYRWPKDAELPDTDFSNKIIAGKLGKLPAIILAMNEHSTNDVQASYDRVADEYVRRIYDELQHKPLDRNLLDRFAATVPSGEIGMRRGMRTRAYCPLPARAWCAGLRR